MSQRDIADFKFIESLFHDFFKKKSIKDKFKFLGDCELTGWENWLQVELSYFFHNYPAISEWERESTFYVDKRIDKIKDKNIIDFLIREKNKSTQNMIAIEVKQNYDASNCLNQIMKDIEKFKTIKPSEYDFVRSFWCLGVHLTISEEQEQKIYNKYEFEEYFELSKFNQKIKGTEFSYTLL